MRRICWSKVPEHVFYVCMACTYTVERLDVICFYRRVPADWADLVIPSARYQICEMPMLCTWDWLLVVSPPEAQTLRTAVYYIYESSITDEWHRRPSFVLLVHKAPNKVLDDIWIKSNRISWMKSTRNFRQPFLYLHQRHVNVKLSLVAFPRA